jgi:hypothetical protein
MAVRINRLTRPGFPLDSPLPAHPELDKPPDVSIFHGEASVTLVGPDSMHMPDERDDNRVEPELAEKLVTA